MQGESRWHARIGTIILLLVTWTGIVVNFIEWKEAIENTRDGQRELRLEVSNARSRMDGLRDRIDAVDDSDLPVRLEERISAMQRQLDRIEQRMKKW